MSFRNPAGGGWKGMITGRGFGSSSRPSSVENAHLQGQGDKLPKKTRMWKGEYAPVFVALGLIIMSTSFGLHTAMQQLGRAPNVSVRKSRRETVPEVMEPDRVLQDARQFINKSFFRKVAHVQADFDPVRAQSNPPGPTSS